MSVSGRNLMTLPLFSFDFFLSFPAVRLGYLLLLKRVSISELVSLGEIKGIKVFAHNKNPNPHDRISNRFTHIHERKNHSKGGEGNAPGGRWSGAFGDESPRVAQTAEAISSIWGESAFRLEARAEAMAQTLESNIRSA